MEFQLKLCVCVHACIGFETGSHYMLTLEFMWIN